MNELALFAGAGGGILGGKLLGWTTVCAVEWEPYPCAVLCARQNEGILPPFPIWDDVRTFDGRPWRGRVDVVSGGFPCQDISAAGRGAGINGERSGMWAHMARIIRDVEPRYVFVENSPILTSRGLGRVLGDLAEMGYDARWGVLGANDVGAPHKRDRMWIVADARHLRGRNGAEPNETQSASASGCGEVCDTVREGLEGANAFNVACESARQYGEIAPTATPTFGGMPRTAWWATEPDVGRVAHGVAARVDRLKAIGNGQVPSVAALAWNTLSNP